MKLGDIKKISPDKAARAVVEYSRLQGLIEDLLEQRKALNEQIQQCKTRQDKLMSSAANPQAELDLGDEGDED